MCTDFIRFSELVSLKFFFVLETRALFAVRNEFVSSIVDNLRLKNLRGNGIELSEK